MKLIGLVINITERKQAEEALRQMNRKLTLLSGITRHDISNQLTLLLEYLYILEKSCPTLHAVSISRRLQPPHSESSQ